jgi:5-methylcytosine-specific restriction enzyme subunit McrC
MIQPPFDFWEHHSVRYSLDQFPESKPPRSKKFGTDRKRFVYEVQQLEEQYLISAGYFVGVDWLIEGETAIVVSPKLDTRIPVTQDDFEIESSENFLPEFSPVFNIDYMGMLRSCLSDDILYREIDQLVHIDWNAQEVNIRQADDLLSPLLIIKYLQLLQQLVRKGLKKSYYPVVNNSNRIKGKILVGPHIKANVFKNRLTQTLCGFEEFGMDSMENRLLKKALLFSQQYLQTYSRLAAGRINFFDEIINFCLPVFEQIGDGLQIADVKNFKANPFFAEYTEAIMLAKMLLKRFSYTISKTSTDLFTTPPYWIDMPKLFELHVYHLLKLRFSKGVKELSYHFSTYGNELDFLVNTTDLKMVVDAKYKPYYKYGTNHQDMRQVSGYARLEKTFAHLGVVDDALISCLIVYPDLEDGLTAEEFLTADLENHAVPGYRKIYKIGVKIPVR